MAFIASLLNNLMIGKPAPSLQNQKKSSSPNAFVGDPVTSYFKAKALGPRLRGEDNALLMLQTR